MSRKSGCQFAHQTARGIPAARHENAVKLAGGLQVGANDLVSNLANRGGLDAQAPQCSCFFLVLFSRDDLAVGLDRCLPLALGAFARAAVGHLRARLSDCFLKALIR